MQHSTSVGSKLQCLIFSSTLAEPLLRAYNIKACVLIYPLMKYRKERSSLTMNGPRYLYLYQEAEKMIFIFSFSEWRCDEEIGSHGESVVYRCTIQDNTSPFFCSSPLFCIVIASFKKNFEIATLLTCLENSVNSKLTTQAMKCVTILSQQKNIYQDWQDFKETDKETCNKINLFLLEKQKATTYILEAQVQILFTFHISLGKVCIQLFLFHLWVDNRTIWALE